MAECNEERGRKSDWAFRLARDRRGLVLRPTGIQERLLGQGHDVDLPPERHFYLQLLSPFLHDCADVDDRAMAEPE